QIWITDDPADRQALAAIKHRFWSEWMPIASVPEDK
ncbi:MAG: hypothetical protein JWR47_2700, partial [Phenylobacterium sp.]|nr:hypothetical protein [Phenylobacterium sp.]